MRVISKKKLRDFWEDHESSKKPLEAWHKRVEKASWTCWKDLKDDFASADMVGDCVVFDVLNNRFRLIARVRFQSHIVYVLKIMTHAAYKRPQWKSECGCFAEPPGKRKNPKAKKRGGKRPCQKQNREMQGTTTSFS